MCIVAIIHYHVLSYCVIKLCAHVPQAHYDMCLMSLYVADPETAANCTIVSTNLPTVTAAGGVIANGTQNVILYCICMRINSMVTVGRTFWFFNGNRITLTGDDGSGNPYSSRSVLDNESKLTMLLFRIFAFFLPVLIVFLACYNESNGDTG